MDSLTIPTETSGGATGTDAGSMLTTDRTAALLVLGSLAFLVALRRVFRGVVI